MLFPLHDDPIPPEVLPDRTQRTLESPTTPLYPERQLEQVFGVLRQVSRWREEQSKEPLQSTVLIVEDTIFIDWKRAFTSPEAMSFITVDSK